MPNIVALQPVCRVASALSAALLMCSLVTAAPAVAATVSGTVRDSSGAPLRDATIWVATAAGSQAATTVTGSDGRFETAPLPAGSYVVHVAASGFVEQAVVVVVRDVAVPLDVRLEVAPFADRVTVTASPGDPSGTAVAAQPVNVIDAEDLRERQVTVVAQSALEEPGLALQRTSPSVAGIYVRGLTGNKVNVFIDGVRYSTGAQRGGINTFLNLVEPTNLDGLEVLRGPSSAQYGSDALGGSVQFQTVSPVLGAQPGLRVGGEIGLGGGSADASAVGNALVSVAGPRVGVVANVSGRHVGEFRAGDGIDSHAAVTRFLGLRSDALMDDRLPDTGFEQFGGFVRGRWAITPNAQVNAAYAHGRQNHGKRYDQLLGGDGNLLADLRGLRLDFFYARYEQLAVLGFDSVSATVSANRQREERVNQGGNGNPRNTITFEPEALLARGISAQATRTLTPTLSLVVGGDAYLEGMDAPSTGLNPVTGVSSIRRGRVPDGATFRNSGAFAQVSYSPARVLQLVGNLRYGGVRYDASAADSPVVNGAPLWPDDHVTASSWTYRASAIGRISDAWTVTGSSSRGFRAPHITDLGTLGLTGSGFEVAAPDIAGRGATVGSSAAATAVSTGLPVEQVTPEVSNNLDLGLRYRSRRLTIDVSAFANRIDGNLEKYALILPQGAVGTTLGGSLITAQSPTGAVYVAASSSPVLVRTNFSDALVRGVEQRVEWRATNRWTLSSVGTWLHASDRDTGRAPNIEGGTPAPEIYLFARYTSADGRWWVEPWLRGVARNTRLSTLDIEDRRSGATRTRTSIQNFFRNGATARGWVSAGPDGVFGTFDDTLLATGETLAQVQTRVLGADVNSSALFTEIPGFVLLGARGGLRLGRHDVIVALDNVTDRNYRGVSWGLDGPGRSVSVRYLLRF